MAPSRKWEHPTVCYGAEAFLIGGKPIRLQQFFARIIGRLGVGEHRRGLLISRSRPGLKPSLRGFFFWCLRTPTLCKQERRWLMAQNAYRFASAAQMEYGHSGSTL